MSAGQGEVSPYEDSSKERKLVRTHGQRLSSQVTGDMEIKSLGDIAFLLMQKSINVLCGQADNTGGSVNWYNLS